MFLRTMVGVCAGGGVLAMLAGPAMAQQQQGPQLQTPWGIYVEGGRTLERRSRSDLVAAGVTYKFGPRHELWGGQITTYGDFFLRNWQASRRFSTHETFTQVGTVANARYRFDHGASPWFADVGIGLTWFDGKYETEDRRFSTQFQFTEVLGIGRSFGAKDEHELQLRVLHVSNGSIKKPNPGENFVNLRYEYHF